MATTQTTKPGRVTDWAWKVASRHNAAARNDISDDLGFVYIDEDQYIHRYERTAVESGKGYLKVRVRDCIMDPSLAQGIINRGGDV